ncbi:hypothetical protein [Sphingomonas aerolata]|uniref:hypothetical protein n=1 Tax=Sphingomonas aerolata TaxID=185951 RepID=UPI002FDF29B2
MRTGRFGLMPIGSANVATWWKAVALLLATQAAIADVELLTAGRGRQAIQCQIILNATTSLPFPLSNITNTFKRSLKSPWIPVI